MEGGRERGKRDRDRDSVLMALPVGWIHSCLWAVNVFCIWEHRGEIWARAEVLWY